MTDGPRRLRAAVVAVVVGVVVALGAGVGACAHHGSESRNRPRATSSTAAGGSGAATAGAGSAAGTLRVGVPEEPASLDPFDPKSRTLAGEAILGEVLPQLFRVDPGGREAGWLADDASVRAAPDGRSATFTLRSGARWSDLPERYGKYKSVHKRFARWAVKGVWDHVFRTLTQDASNEYLMIDSTIVRAHQQAATGRKKGARIRLWGVPEED